MKNISNLLKKAEKGRSQMDGACGQIARILQPFFAEEISVDFQPGDGFVVICEDGFAAAPNNLPVDDAVRIIQNDQNAFLNCL